MSRARSPRVLLGQHASHRHVDVIGVGDVGFPVRECHFFGFDHQVNRLGRPESQGRHIVLPYDIEFLQENVAAGIGRGLVDRVIAVVGRNRFLPTSGAVVEVSHGQQTALLLAESHNGLADSATVESVSAVLGNC